MVLHLINWNEGSGADVLNNFERLQFDAEDQNGNWDEVEFIVDHKQINTPEDIVIRGTSGDDTIVSSRN